MKTLSHLFENNRQWAKQIETSAPDFFRTLSSLQSPEYLWIGCSDSRVPANQITGLMPGEVFVHRNIANVVVHSDLNCLSVVQFAVDVLKVKHIIVCGHYGCGGVRAALNNDKMGLADNWLRHIQDVWIRYRPMFEQWEQDQHWDKLCELNVISQAVNVAQTTVLRDAWARGQDITVHGWIYGLKDGLLRDLKMCIDNADTVSAQLDAALSGLQHP